jgi:hypothetical protein
LSFQFNWDDEQRKILLLKTCFRLIEGSLILSQLNATLFEKLRFLTIKTVLEESPGYRRLNIPKAPRKQKKAKVARFRISRNDSISGIVPMVQSQQSSEGFNRSQAFTGRR